MKRIRKGDTVIVTTGKSRGHVGVVERVLSEKVIVAGANFVHRYVKRNPQINEQGGIIKQEAPLHISNIAILNPLSKKADKVGFRFIQKDGVDRKVRFYKSNDEIIDAV